MYKSNHLSIPLKLKHKEASREVMSDFAEQADMNLFTSLGPREVKTVVARGLTTRSDFAEYDFSLAADLPNVGQNTIESLSMIQRQLVRQLAQEVKFVNVTTKWSLFRLSWTDREIDILLALRLFTQSEFINAFLPFHALVDASLEKERKHLQERQNALLQQKNLISDSRTSLWSEPISESALATLPFFGGKSKDFFAVTSFHPSYCPNLLLQNIVAFKSSKALLDRLLGIGISTLGELLLSPLGSFNRMRHITLSKIQKFQSHIKTLLLCAHDEHVEVSSDLLDLTSPQHLLDSLFQLALLGEREHYVLQERLEGKRLASIAQKFSLTRERIRQIEDKSKRRIRTRISKYLLEDIHLAVRQKLTNFDGFCSLETLGEALKSSFQWNQNSCPPIFFKFLMELVQDSCCTLLPGNYVATQGFFCHSCPRLAEYIKQWVFADRDRLSVSECCRRDAFSCCNGCPTPHRLTDDFFDWFCRQNKKLAPMIEEAGFRSATSKSVQKKLHAILAKSPQPMNIQAITMLLNRETKDVQYTPRQICTVIGNLTQKSREILLWGRGGVYMHRRNINTTLPLLDKIESTVLQSLQKKTIRSLTLYSIFDAHKEECLENGIPSAFALYACLKAREHAGIAFMRIPTVCRPNERHSRELIKSLAVWTIQQENVFDRKKLLKFAKSTMGITDNRFPNFFVYLCKRHPIVRYKENTFVHLDVLEWTSEKQNQLESLAHDYWEQSINGGNLYARIEGLFDNHQAELPELARSITWNTTVLFSLLSRSSKVLTFGNTNSAFGFDEDHAPMKTIQEVLVHVLKNRFGGKAPLRDVSKYFREEIRLVKEKLSPSILQKCPNVKQKEDKIYLSEDDTKS